MMLMGLTDTVQFVNSKQSISTISLSMPARSTFQAMQCALSGLAWNRRAAPD
jgi:hypothetical protein